MRPTSSAQPVHERWTELGLVRAARTTSGDREDTRARVVDAAHSAVALITPVIVAYLTVHCKVDVIEQYIDQCGCAVCPGPSSSLLLHPHARWRARAGRAGRQSRHSPPPLLATVLAAQAAGGAPACFVSVTSTVPSPRGTGAPARTAGVWAAPAARMRGATGSAPAVGKASPSACKEELQEELRLQACAQLLSFKNPAHVQVCNKYARVLLTVDIQADQPPAKRSAKPPLGGLAYSCSGECLTWLAAVRHGAHSCSCRSCCAAHLATALSSWSSQSMVVPSSPLC